LDHKASKVFKVIQAPRVIKGLLDRLDRPVRLVRLVRLAPREQKAQAFFSVIQAGICLTQL